MSALLLIPPHLEHKLMAIESETPVPAAQLFDLAKSILLSTGIPEQDAEDTAHCLVTANLRGVDTHGVIRLKVYTDRLRAGGNKPHPNVQVVRETPVAAVMDADDALGPVAGCRAMNLAIEKAGAAGVGLVAIRRGNHYGPAAHYAMMAVEHDMIGMSMTNVLASMPPTGGRQALIGNNPVAVAVPAGQEPTVVLDIATSLGSWGTVFTCAQKGEPLPPDRYLDADGNPTLKPEDILGGGGCLLPIASYKGYGMALVMSVLTGLLADGVFDPDIPHPYNFLDKGGENAYFQAAFRIDQFADVSHFKSRMDETIRLIRSSPRAPGADRIYLPGEKEHDTRQEREANGIPLNTKMVDELKALAVEAGVPCDL